MSIGMRLTSIGRFRNVVLFVRSRTPRMRSVSILLGRFSGLPEVPFREGTRKRFVAKLRSQSWLVIQARHGEALRLCPLWGIPPPPVLHGRLPNPRRGVEPLFSDLSTGLRPADSIVSRRDSDSWRGCLHSSGPYLMRDGSGLPPPCRGTVGSARNRKDSPA